MPEIAGDKSNNYIVASASGNKGKHATDIVTAYRVNMVINIYYILLELQYVDAITDVFSNAVICK